MNDREIEILRRERDHYIDYLIEWIRLTPDHFVQAEADVPQPGSTEFQNELRDMKGEASTHLRTVLRAYRLYADSENDDRNSETRIADVVSTEESAEIETMIEQEFSAVEEEYEQLLADT
jgi:hypothetical protein